MKTMNKAVLVTLLLTFAVACGGAGQDNAANVADASPSEDGSSQDGSPNEIQPPYVGQVVPHGKEDVNTDAGTEDSGSSSEDAGNDAGNVCHRHHHCDKTCD